jgi:PAS domain S-box-containing protein
MSKFPRWLIVSFGLTMLVMFSCGVWFYHVQEKKLRQRVEDDLQSIAQLKVNQIAQWRYERLAEAAFLMDSSNLDEVISRWMSDPEPDDERKILSRFRSVYEHFGCNDVLLVDTHGKLRLGLRGQVQSLDKSVLELLSLAFRDRRPEITDLHAGHDDMPPHIDVIAPFFALNREENKPVGAVVIQINAQQFLYPLIQLWPTASRSAETLLVRRDGDAVLFLNELRHQTGTALKFAIPLSHRDVPAVMAALGKEGVFHGKYYRWAEVLSVLKAIPNSPWRMVTKVDESEAFAAWRLESILIVSLIVAMMASLAATIGVIWQRNSKAQYKALLKSEAERRKSEERYRNLVEFLPKMLGVHIRQKWVYMNPAGVRLLGAKSEGELLGKEIQEIVAPEFQDIVSSRLEQVQKEGLSAPEIEEQFIRLDGARVDVSVSAVPIDYRGEPGIIVFAEDISARKKAEEELRRYHDELERSNAELQQFAYVASHDLQEPLRMVSSYMGLIEGRYKGRLDADADDFIGYAVDGAKRMRMLINDLLEYSRVGTHGKTFGPVDCETLLNRVLDHVQLLIEDSGATITHDPLPTVIGDGAQLMRLFQNLINNSLKFKKDAPPLIHVSAEPCDRNWLFSVHDNGIGIDPQYADRIFVIFQRLHDREEYPGTGIGLAICKKIVERHGGHIRVQSEQGNGATFFFTIPRQDLKS